MDSVWIDRIWPLMEEAFPPVERRSLEAQRALLSRPDFALRVVTQGERVAGFITWWELGACRFVEHLAVERGLRGQGLGQKLLRLACGGVKKPVVLEIEPPETGETALRRLGFYRRNGFAANLYPYQQLPLNPGDAPLDLVLLSYPKALTPQRFAPLKKDVYTTVYGVREI